MIEFTVGWLMLLVGASLAWHVRRHPADPVDHTFQSAPRDTVEVVDRDRIRQIFTDMTEGLPDPDLSVYYLLPGKEDQR